MRTEKIRADEAREGQGRCVRVRKSVGREPGHVAASSPDGTASAVETSRFDAALGRTRPSPPAGPGADAEVAHPGEAAVDALPSAEVPGEPLGAIFQVPTPALPGVLTLAPPGLLGPLAPAGAPPWVAPRVMTGELAAGATLHAPSTEAAALGLELESRIATEAAPAAEGTSGALPEAGLREGPEAPAATDARASEPALPRTTPSASSSTALGAMPGSAELDRASEILRQLRLHLVPGLRQATIDLAPAELGRISIRLTLEEGSLVASVRAEKHATLDLLGRHLPELRASLEQQGIHTERFDLSLGFEGRGGRDPSPEPRHGGALPSAFPESAAALHAELAPLRRALASASGIDTYA